MKKLTRNLTIKVNNIHDILIAPTQDPLSEYDYIQSGEAALPRAIRYINPKEYKHISQITICLPSVGKEEKGLNKIRHIIQHYLNFQLKEDHRKMMVFKHNTARIFRNAIIFLIICMAIVTLIGMESFLPNLPPLMRSVLVEGFTVVGWVIMWRPIELILNRWTELKIESQIYQQLLKANIKINHDKDV